jgi:heme exporter protein D
MSWGSLAEFLSMRGYGLYVWGSYGAAAMLMLAEAWLVRRHLRHARRGLAAPVLEHSA